MIHRFMGWAARAVMAVCLSLAAAGVFQTAPSAAAPKSIEWNDAQIRWRSFAEGLREAQATGKPILAVFYADWCPHCLGYSRLFRDPQIVRLSQALVMVKVDGDRQPDIGGRYEPDGGYVPRTMVLDRAGRLVGSLRGGNARYRHFIDYQSTDELAAMMKGAAALK